MPIKGIILIFILAIAVALYYREEIYSWLSSETSDEDCAEDEENFKEE